MKVAQDLGDQLSSIWDKNAHRKARDGSVYALTNKLNFKRALKAAVHDELSHIKIADAGDNWQVTLLDTETSSVETPIRAEFSKTAGIIDISTIAARVVLDREATYETIGHDNNGRMNSLGLNIANKITQSIGSAYKAEFG